MKQINVLLSTFNGEKYLEELLNSVLSQEEVKIEFWIRDDGSTDQTIQILKDYQNKYNNIHLSLESNIGYIQSFWTLLTQVNQEGYYAFCDQDDIWLPNKCISAIKLIEKQKTKGPILYTSNTKGINEKGKLLQDKVFPLERVLTYPESLIRGSLPGCTFLFNKELRDNAIKYKGAQISHDWTLYTIAKIVGCVLYDSHSYIQYRLHQDNTIGFQQSKLKHIQTKIQRFFKQEYKGVRSEIANFLLETYKEQMCQEDKEVTILLSNYKKRPLQWLSLLKIKEYRNLNVILQVITKNI